MAKNKIKTKRAAAKRFKVSGTGKIIHFRAGKSHLLRKKNRKRKRRLLRDAVVDKSHERSIQVLIPYKF
ncbi:50S ribosomal protein L35 [Thermosulfuriphilus ammonigenes]|uniref:Large ribosomal subunit protein bL35 n=1 Tax=Thermosulfuriphilus ammonigenes TaxID=1936021 RepID=A0A6G7PYE3_9BACT|nr:50S ribosomal protein L35 [Thermosulfuriphilus ammonigenes]MBA2849347.1 large subunit ribosomal protein L35 [Thermosulfuriphilus ammonigenes]QIJ72423.1 50S ribosomal protein L35 [Thermosulfuriphilus ammonigenes]